MSICLASLSDRSTSTSVRRSSNPLWTKRKPPAVKVELPPRSSSLAFSSTSTLAPCSFAERAAHSAALPAPTTITSYGPASAMGGLLILRRTSLRTVAAIRKASHSAAPPTETGTMDEEAQGAWHEIVRDVLKRHQVKLV